MRFKSCFFWVIIALILFVQPRCSFALEHSLRFEFLTTNEGLPQNSVYSIVQDRDGFMWFGTWGGVVRYDGYTFKLFRAMDDSTALPDNRINAIILDSNRNLWIETGDPTALCRYDEQQEQFVRYARKDVPKAVLKQLENYYRSGIKNTGSDRMSFSIKGQSIYQNGMHDKGSFQVETPLTQNSKHLNSIYLDNQDNLWVGTLNHGVAVSNLRGVAFRSYEKGKEGLGFLDNSIRAVCTDTNGQIWVGTDEGITVIERANNRTRFWNIDKKRLIHPYVRMLYSDRNGNMWIGTKGGLDRWDPKTSNIQHYPSDGTQNLYEPNIYTILEDKTGRLWMGTFDGLALYDPIKDAVRPSGIKLSGKRIRALMEDRSGTIWVGTEDAGLDKLVPDGKKFKLSRYRHQANTENSLINNRVFSMAEDADGRIWIGTNGGLSVLNPKNDSFRHYTIRNGLTDDIIMGVLFDRRGSIWVSHQRGITRIGTKNGHLRNFNMHDGLQSNEFNQSACFRDPRSGELFFGGTNGLNSFDPSRIPINPHKPKVVLTELYVLNRFIQPRVRIDNRIILEKSLVHTNAIQLYWKDKTFRIGFSALHFDNPSENQYKYRLQGYDKDWIVTDANMRYATYSNLSPGHYTFEVLASNSDGIWNDQPTTLQVEIVPPFWQTGWAFALYFLILGLLGWFLYRYVSSRLEWRRNEALHQAKLTFFTEISHEFRTPLTLIIDPVEKLISEETDPTTTQRYLSLIHRNAKQLLVLINQLLDFRKLESGKLTLNVQPIDLVSFVKNVVATFETTALERNIALDIQSDIEYLQVDMDETKMNMVLNNLLSNAMKFTPPKGSVTVSIHRLESENKLELSVSDTGQGIAKDDLERIFELFYQSSTGSGLGSGIGLALTRELVHLHGGNILVESKLDRGSTFRVQLPVSHSQTSTNQLSTKTLQETTTFADTQTSSVSDKPLLLIIDDQEDIREYLKLRLENAYQVVTTNNGITGMEKAFETLPDIVVSDVMMPGLDGLELCRRLKTDERTSHIPVVLLTARQSVDFQAEGYETGADAYVTKPFNSKVLQAQLKNLLAQRKQLRDYFAKDKSFDWKKMANNITDESFLNKVIQLVEIHMGEESFDFDLLAEKMKMSRSQFARKIKALTNQTIFEFVTAYRMKRALDFLLSGEYNISETAYKVGFSLPNNFSRAFAKHFGSTPSKFLDSLR